MEEKDILLERVSIIRGLNKYKGGMKQIKGRSLLSEKLDN
jgi:hypothetical protein